MATGYLLDTNVLSETRKVRAHSGVIAFLAGTDTADLFLSALTLGELRQGVEGKRRTDPVAAERLGAWADEIETMFGDRVIPVDIAIARRWGELSAGRSLPVIDTLIAATAIEHGLILVTRNTRDVAPTGAEIVNPWKSDEEAVEKD